MRRSPLPRRRAPLRRVGRRGLARAEERRTLVEELFRSNPICVHPACTRLANDPHEVIPRGRGGDDLDRTNVVPLCRQHHRWVHDHPAEATALGLLASRPPVG